VQTMSDIYSVKYCYIDGSRSNLDWLRARKAVLGHGRFGMIPLGLDDFNRLIV